MNEAITHDTLAGEWRRRMVARSTIGAVLLAIPVMAAAAIGFSAGPGGLPFGISSFANGPSSELPSGDGERPAGSDSISQLLGDTAATVVAAAPSTSAAGGAGSAGGGGGGGPGSGPVGSHG